MRENNLKKLWAEGRGALNCWLNIDSTLAAEAMSFLDWDSITIDMQHSLVDWHSALAMLQTCAVSDATLLMRVPWNDPAWIMRALDAGCYGIICPMVNTREDCEKFVGACRYAPAGYRSYGPVRGLTYGGPDYFERANDTIVALAMIETQQAIDNLDDIMSTPGLDGIYVGPNDLSISLGCKPQYMPVDAPVVAAVDRILAGAKKHGLMPGIHCGSPEMAAMMIEKGFQFCTVQSTTKIMADASKTAIATARAMLAKAAE